MHLLLDALLVPHAPVLLPEVNGAGTDEIRRALDDSVPLTDRAVTVWVSPHAAEDCIYSSGSGDLRDFGITNVTVQVEIDAEHTRELARRWDRPMMEAPLDHGLVVPLFTLGAPGPIIAVGLGETEHQPESIAALAEAIAALSDGADLLVVASVHGAASLSDRAPLTDRPEGHELQGALDDALTADPSRLLDIDETLWDVGGSCSRSIYGLIGRLFSGRRFDLLAAGHPFGVGYRVGRLA